MSDTVDALAYKTDVKERVKDNVRQKTNAVTSRVSSMMSGVSNNVPSGDEIAGQAQQGMRMAQQNPLGLAIGSIAVGFLAGLLIPSTEMEDRKIGPLADEVKDQALETGKEAMNRGQQVAQDAAKTAQQSGQQHAQELGQNAAARARNTANAVPGRVAH
jgi:gas vesicle protein